MCEEEVSPNALVSSVTFASHDTLPERAADHLEGCWKNLSDAVNWRPQKNNYFLWNCFWRVKLGKIEIYSFKQAQDSGTRLHHCGAGIFFLKTALFSSAIFAITIVIYTGETKQIFKSAFTVFWEKTIRNEIVNGLKKLRKWFWEFFFSISRDTNADPLNQAFPDKALSSQWMK